MFVQQLQQLAMAHDYTRYGQHTAAYRLGGVQWYYDNIILYAIEHWNVLGYVEPWRRSSAAVSCRSIVKRQTYMMMIIIIIMEFLYIIVVILIICQREYRHRWSSDGWGKRKKSNSNNARTWQYTLWYYYIIIIY